MLSLIDGKPYQTLKRHLSKHGLTAEQYRERYGQQNLSNGSQGLFGKPPRDLCGPIAAD